MQPHLTIVQLKRKLRKEATEAEKLLWQYLRNRKLSGYKFLRQYAIYYHTPPTLKKFFIADFYCADKKLVLELDGTIHENQKEYDQNRDAILTQLGLKIVRFNNAEITENLTHTLNTLLHILNNR